MATGIKPKLAYFDLTMIVVSLVIGIGIFRTPAIIAQKAGTPAIFFTAWILGGIVAICGALTFAEIGSRLPVAGGFYKIFSYCYHPAYAFMFNWAGVVINAASAVGVAIAGAEYLNPIILPSTMQGDAGVRFTALTVLLVLFILNYIGIKTGARTQNILSAIKIVLIVAFSLAIFGHHNAAVVAASPVHLSTGAALSALGVSFISIFFTYGGYQNTINFGADIDKPAKNIPRSILTGMGIVIVLYLSINLAYYYVLGFDTMQHSKLLAAELAKAFFGEKGLAITSIAIFISTVGFINTSMMYNPRIYYAMADDKILPPIFKKVNEKTMTQEFALGFFLALMIFSLFLLGTFEKIINYVMFIDSMALASAAATIFIFRYREKQAGTTLNEAGQPIYRVLLYPVVPAILILFLLVVTVNVLFSDPMSALYGSIIFILGYPLYRVMRAVVK